MTVRRSRFAKALLAATVLTAPLPAMAAEADDAATLGELVVTANRRDESLKRVPASVAAYTQESMDALGVRKIEDIVKLTPGLNFFRRTQFTGSNTYIAIRGLQSFVGTPTTGIYIDDVPIQARVVGFSASTVYPKVFDLERVEVLRGPQGTLFGAGAEGGAIRFITRAPSLTDYSGYGRGEFSLTEHGGASYEAGAAVGGPIIKDQLGFRLSAWHRKDGGYVDRVNATTGATVDANSNSQKTSVIRGALTWKPTAELTITPAIYFQDLDIQDSSSFWEALSNPGEGSFRNGQVQAQPQHDRFFLPSVDVSYDFGPVTLVSTTSGFDRRQNEIRDYTNFDNELVRPGVPYASFPGQIAYGFMGNKQRNFTQEVRLQSNGEGRLKYIVGAFYSDERQSATQKNQDAFLEGIVRIRTNGALGVAGWFGLPYLPNFYIYDSYTRITTEQLSGFGQVDYNITDAIKLTAGVRVSEIKVGNNQVADGPFAGTRISTQGKFKEHPVTPKFGASWQIDPDNMVYATIAKGFRPGGAQTRVVARCAPELAQLGYTTSPDTYDSDSAWSYEAGSKNTLMDGKVSVDASAYVIKWKNIQNSLYMPLCATSFVANTGDVTSKGFDVNLQVRPMDGLNLSLALGYNKATYDHDVLGGSGLLLFGKGDYAAEGPKLSYTVSGQYDFPLFSDERDAFVRADYSYGDRAPDKNPRSFGFDAQRRYADELKVLTVRAGVRRDGLVASIFAENLADSHPLAGRYRLFGASPLFTNATIIRPRTFGATVTYEY